MIVSLSWWSKPSDQSSVTRQWYAYDVEEWLKTLGITFVEELDLQVVNSSFSQGAYRHLKPSTKRRRVAAIKAFFVYLENVLRLLPTRFFDRLMCLNIDQVCTFPWSFVTPWERTHSNLFKETSAQNLTP